jgi:hypothetical protein
MHDFPFGETTVGRDVRPKQDRFGLYSYPRRMMPGSTVPSGIWSETSIGCDEPWAQTQQTPLTIRVVLTEGVAERRVFDIWYPEPAGKRH